MAALDRFPSAVLVYAVFGFFLRMPAYGRGVKENLRSLHRGQPRSFGVPLVPTNEHTDFPEFGVPCAEPGVAGRKIELLIVKRIIGNVHFPVDAEQAAVGVDNHGRVVIKT